MYFYIGSRMLCHSSTVCRCILDMHGSQNKHAVVNCCCMHWHCKFWPF